MNDPCNPLVHVMYARQLIFLFKFIRVDINELRLKTKRMLVKLINNP